MCGNLFKKIHERKSYDITYDFLIGAFYLSEQEFGRDALMNNKVCFYIWRLRYVVVYSVRREA